MLTAGAMAALPELVRRPLAAFAAEYLAEGVPFGGRDEELAALDAWLGDPQRPCALVVARFARALKAGARRGRARFLTEDSHEERPRQMARALLALGGEAAGLAAKRACVEVGRWFP